MNRPDRVPTRAGPVWRTSPSQTATARQGQVPPRDAPGAVPISSASYAVARRIVVAVIGSTLLALGGVLLLVPGPGLLVLGLGLGVLALEFAWARRWLGRLRDRVSRLARPTSDEARD